MGLASFPQRAIAASGLLSALITARPAGAVRPFVTDDARISAYGQLEAEAWIELVRSGRTFTPGYNVLGGVSPTEWLQIIAGGGVSIDPGAELGVPNPVIQPKLLIWRAEDNGIPGLSVAMGVTLPVGRGEAFEKATGLYLIAPVTSRLFDDWLLLHANLGVRAAYLPADAEVAIETGWSARPYWGIGADVGLFHPDLRGVVEAYAGDPLHAIGPTLAFQWGARWMVSDHVNMDLTFGAEPTVHEGVRVEGGWNTWGQLGARLLFDVFTNGPGDPDGALGMVPAPGAPPR
jgi:hypothetical protein